MQFWGFRGRFLFIDEEFEEIKMDSMTDASKRIQKMEIELSESSTSLETKVYWDKSKL